MAQVAIGRCQQRAGGSAILGLNGRSFVPQDDFLKAFGAANRERHRARRVTFDGLPVLDELREILVAAELLGELRQIREDDRLARRERECLLQDFPRPVGLRAILATDLSLPAA